MRLGALVVEEAGQPSVLRHRRRRGVSVQLARQLLLQALHQSVLEADDAPEDVHVIRRRVKNITGLRQVAACPRTREHSGTIMIGIEKYMPNRGDGVSSAGAAARRDRVYTDEDIEHSA